MNNAVVTITVQLKAIALTKSFFQGNNFAQLSSDMQVESAQHGALSRESSKSIVLQMNE